MLRESVASVNVRFTVNNKGALYFCAICAGWYSSALPAQLAETAYLVTEDAYPVDPGNTEVEFNYSYVTADNFFDSDGIDKSRAGKIEKLVAEWREKDELFLPGFPDDEISAIEGTLPYPPPGAPAQSEDTSTGPKDLDDDYDER